MKSEDERFAEEKFGNTHSDQDDYEEVPNFAEEQEYDQDYYDEQVLNQESNDCEEDEDEMSKEN